MGECGLARSPLIHSVIHPRVSKFVLEITVFITEFLAWSPFKTYIRADRQTDRQTELASYVIEDDVHFIRATGTPSLCPSSPARPRPCPAHCPLGTNAAPPLGRPLFHESYTLYRHLPSPSRPPSPLARSLCPPSSRRLVMCAVKLVQPPSQCSVGGCGGPGGEAERQTECRHREFVFLDASSYPWEF